MSDVPKSVWQGSFRIAGVELKCHVLDDGSRIIEAESLAEFFEALSSGPITVDPRDMVDFHRWRLGQKEPA